MQTSKSNSTFCDSLSGLTRTLLDDIFVPSFLIELLDFGSLGLCCLFGRSLGGLLLDLSSTIGGPLSPITSFISESETFATVSRARGSEMVQKYGGRGVLQSPSAKADKVAASLTVKIPILTGPLCAIPHFMAAFIRSHYISFELVTKRRPSNNNCLGSLLYIRLLEGEKQMERLHVDRIEERNLIKLAMKKDKWRDLMRKARTHIGLAYR
ncbi:hypothetical protein C0J52_01819 [Blattella germanica]|nr:hypothetical protein C0J52_01819 [Blattella germanica]